MSAFTSNMLVSGGELNFTGGAAGTGLEGGKGAAGAGAAETSTFSGAGGFAPPQSFITWKIRDMSRNGGGISPFHIVATFNRIF